MQALFIASAFGVLVFLASAAALALEPPPQALGVWHASLVVLAGLNAASGFTVLGGGAALGEGQWSVVGGCAAAGLASAVLATVAAMHLAAILELDLKPRAARQVVMLALASGIIALTIAAKLGQPPMD
ncbi:MAG: hypothetical protein ABW200_04315 [Hyphomicrobiaceae bacterium]